MFGTILALGPRGVLRVPPIGIAPHNDHQLAQEVKECCQESALVSPLPMGRRGSSVSQDKHSSSQDFGLVLNWTTLLAKEMVLFRDTLTSVVHLYTVFS